MNGETLSCSSATSAKGNTPLHYAADNFFDDRLVEILLQAGADPVTKNNDSQTPLDRATWWTRRVILKEIDKRKKDQTSLDENKSTTTDSQSTKDQSETQKRPETTVQSFEQPSNIQSQDQAILSDKDINILGIVDPKEFKDLLTQGEYESFNNRIHLGGACNVGKTTLASVLIGKEIPKDWDSTDSLTIFYGRNGIDLENREMVPLNKDFDDHDVLSNVLRGNPAIAQSPVSTDQAKTSIHAAVTELEIGSNIHNIAYLSVNPEHQSEDTPKELPPLPTSTAMKLNETTYKPQFKPGLKLQHYKKLYVSIHETVKEEIRRGEYKVRIAPSDLVDFGGQKSYDLTHQLFIQQNGAFVLMLDCRRKLIENLPEYKTENITTASTLLHWVNSILTYCSGGDKDIYPVILFAATHKDMLSGDEIREKEIELKEGLAKMFSSHTHSNRILFSELFFINTTDINDSGLMSLKNRLVDLAFQQKSWGQKMPMAWVPLELQITQMRSDEVSLISIDDVQKLNEENKDLALSEKQLKHFLRNQHSLGRILRFETPGLDSFIIVQPTALVDILRSFITDEIFWPQIESLRRILEQVTTLGSIKKMDLFKLWSQEEFQHHMPDNDVKEYIAKVLVHMDILVEPKRYGPTEQATDIFLVPCMIKRSCPSCNIGDGKAIYLSYTLKSGIPNAMIYKLIGAVLNIWPIKEAEGKLCLYNKAAFITIDAENDLHISFQGNSFVACLINQVSKLYLSADVASVVQECLTLTLKKVLEFYFKSFGNSLLLTEIDTLYEIRVGEECGHQICYISLNDAKSTKTWRCKDNIEHSTKFPLYWDFDRTQKECLPSCSGLDRNHLKEPPSDKHLIRLVSLISLNKMLAFVTKLGLSSKEWEDISYVHLSRTDHTGTVSKFIALSKCRDAKDADDDELTFQDLYDGLEEINYDSHNLCKVFRDKIESAYGSQELQNVPGDEELQQVSKKVGNSAVHLGIELGLELSAIEGIIHKHEKSLHDQVFGVLKEWKETRGNKTLRYLMQALKHADVRGYKYLKRKFCFRQEH